MALYGPVYGYMALDGPGWPWVRPWVPPGMALGTSRVPPGYLYSGTADEVPGPDDDPTRRRCQSTRYPGYLLVPPGTGTCSGTALDPLVRPWTLWYGPGTALVRPWVPPGYHPYTITG